MKTYRLTLTSPRTHTELTFPIQYLQTVNWRMYLEGHKPLFTQMAVRGYIIDGSGATRVYAQRVEPTNLSGTVAFDWGDVGTGRLILDADDQYCTGWIEIDMNERVPIGILRFEKANFTYVDTRVFQAGTVYRPGLRVMTPAGVGELELLADTEPAIDTARTGLSIATPRGVFRVCM